MTLSGIAAGVPFVALPPAGGSRPGAPVVLAWHLLDAPRTEVAFAAAVPLAGLDAWKIYFGLPLSGSRMPPGGPAEIQERIAEDVVLRLHRYVVDGAAEEFPSAYAVVRKELGLADDVPLGVMGGSMGSAVAQLVLAGEERPARAAVLFSPVTRMRATIDALARHYGTTYDWTPASSAFADRTDFLARAAEIGRTPIRYVAGADDLSDAFLEPVAEVTAELDRRGATVDLQVVPGMGHALAAEPGTAAAPQTPQAAAADRLAVEWFQRYL
jgi:pimeloyl-ACP methyl ester carboxylesterase